MGEMMSWEKYVDFPLFGGITSPQKHWRCITYINTARMGEKKNGR